MRDAGLLMAAMLACVVGMGWLALSMDPHWTQVRGTTLPRSAAVRLRGLGALGLAVSLALCLRVDHASMASLVWIMAIAASALTVALTLAWRPRWLRMLTFPAGDTAHAANEDP